MFTLPLRRLKWVKKLKFTGTGLKVSHRRHNNNNICSPFPAFFSWTRHDFIDHSPIVVRMVEAKKTA